MASLAAALVAMLLTTSLVAKMALQAAALVAMLLVDSMAAVMASLEAKKSVDSQVVLMSWKHLVNLAASLSVIEPSCTREEVCCDFNVAPMS